MPGYWKSEMALGGTRMGVVLSAWRNINKIVIGWGERARKVVNRKLLVKEERVADIEVERDIANGNCEQSNN